VKEAQKTVIERLVRILKRGTPTLREVVLGEEFVQHERDMITFSNFMARQYGHFLGVPRRGGEHVLHHRWNPFRGEVSSPAMYETWRAAFGTDAIFAQRRPPG
jgi:hypothetical protein